MSALRNAALVCAGVLWAMSAAAGQDAPERDTAAVVRTRCTVCHAMDLIAQQRLTRPGWDREVAKMIGWGAAVDPSRASDVAAYLASQFGVTDRKAITSPPERTTLATNLLHTRCTVCHAADLIDAQRLDADGWGRELAKMVGWGAVLSPDERALVVEHLASGPRHPQ